MSEPHGLHHFLCRQSEPYTTRYRSVCNHLSSWGFRKTPSLKCLGLRTGLNFTAQQRADGGSVGELSCRPETEEQTCIDSVQSIISTRGLTLHRRDPADILQMTKSPVSFSFRCYGKAAKARRRFSRSRIRQWEIY